MKRRPPASNDDLRAEARAKAQAAAKRSALNALRRAKRLAERTGVKLSDWEGEFLGSVEGRVGAYGRAFADPDKGAPGQALSTLQTVKLKEIADKARGKTKGKAKPRPGLRRNKPMGPSR